MGNEYDHFDDFLGGEAGAQEGGGILDSQGLRDYEGIETHVEAGGAAVTSNCRKCNKKRKVIIEWPELIILGTNAPGKRPILPRGWQFSQNNLDAFVALRCTACGEDGFNIHMAPTEAQQHVRAGLNSGLIQPQVVQQYTAQAEQARG